MNNTRFKILKSARQVGTPGGATASRIAEHSGLHVSTVRRHLNDMRNDPTSEFASHLISIGTNTGYLYRCETLPVVKLVRKAKVRKTRTVKIDPTPFAPITVEVTPKPHPVSVRIILALDTPQGIHELGQSLRVKRGVLQAILVQLIAQQAVTGARVGGRWVYTRAS